MNQFPLSTWSFIFGIVGSLCVPFTVPWLIYILFHHKKARKNLHGKVVLITGASSGLGEALSHVFYRSGCRVILASRNVEMLERVKSDLLAAHTIVETFTPEILELDLSDLRGLSIKAKTALGFYGHIDILINNGGISFRGNVESTSLEVDMKLMTINYFGQVQLTKALLPSMIKKGEGHIVAVSSVQGRIAIPFRSAYAASKHAVQAFFDCLRAEVSGQGIKVTVVSPGYIKTNLSLNALTGNGQKYGVLDSTTANGFTPEEVAEATLGAILRNKKELVVSPSSPKLAILIRTLCPSLYFYIMQKRALKRE